MSLRVLSPLEKNRLITELSERYRFDAEALEDTVLLESGGEVWATTRDALQLPLKALKTESVGLLIAREREGGAEPTVAALQLYARPGKDALRTTREDAGAFIERKTIPVDLPEGTHVVFYGDHALDMGHVRGGKLTRSQ